jgi:ferritin heavy chain
MITRAESQRQQSAASSSANISGVVFEPFSAVESELATTQKASSNASYGRTDFHPECEAAINEQINIEYNVSYVYHAMYTYFARDNVGLPGIAEFFKKESAEERHHAELLMEYQIKRGGAVKLETIMPPHTEFDHPDKGDALYAFELSLSLEKLNFQKLRGLHEVAEKHGDSQMCDFIEGSLLADQADSVYEVAEKVAQLRRVGKGLGVYVFDQELGGAQ